MKVQSIHPDSPLFGYVRTGWQLVSVNGREVTDTLDYQFKSADDHLSLIFENSDGAAKKFDFGVERPNDLGVIFEDDRILRCKANCIFCFVHQQPKGMRRSLYVKDDDFRLSFKHGNFVTLSNLTRQDVDRIIAQGLSPLYVSVHATDNKLRRCLLRNEKLEPIVPMLKRLIGAGIVFHTQVVVCPGINDGPALNRTIEDLAKLYPGVRTIGIVPVGLTRYRQKLTPLKTYDRGSAAEMIDIINSFQKEFLQRYGTRLVFAADEFYVLAGHDVPRLSEYEEMEQFENGIGMLRWTITQFNRRKKSLYKTKSKKKIAVITGVSAAPTLQKEIIEPLVAETGFNVGLIPIENKFWGKTVTVSGLLTGGDIMRTVKKIDNNYDTILLPPNCINDDNLFLDDMKLDYLKNKSEAEIKVGSYFIADSLREALS